MSAKGKKCRLSGKVKFQSHERALVRAGQILGEQGSRKKSFRAYLCGLCNHYHLTTH